MGLLLNFSKCELYVSEKIPTETQALILDKFNNLAPNIKLVDKYTLRLLGSPVLEESIPNFLYEQLDKFQKSSDHLEKINIHMAFQIIKFCLFVPKFTYFLRCSPIWKFPNILASFDTCILNILTEILNCQITDKAWQQASLPIRFGGIGIRKASAIALPAFLSSIHSTNSLVNKIISPSLGNIQFSFYREAIDAWKEASGMGSLPATLNSQRLWDEPLCRVNFQKLVNTASNASERARLLAVATWESGLWLHALPSPNLGTFLDNTTFSIAVSLRLGLHTNHPHCCPCGAMVDRLGHHGLSCQRSAGRMSRHAALNDVIRRALVSINVPALLEPNGIARDDGKRPDGLTLVPWKGGRCLVWDATCVDTLAPSHLHATSEAAGAAASDAQTRKRRKYMSLSRDYIFLPFAVETLGSWGDETKHFFNVVSSRLIEHTGDRKAGAYFGQRISLAIQRGNVASILGTLPKGSSLDEVFYI